MAELESFAGADAIISQERDTITTHDDANVSNTGPKVSSRTPLRTATDCLEKIGHIGSFKTRHTLPRYIPLEKQAIFNSLVELYALHFQSKRLILEPLLKGLSLPRGVQGNTHLARIYVSHWFIDLYVSNREACTRIPLARSSDYYSAELARQSQIYDNFLVLLLNDLKPTKLPQLPDSSIYIPVIIHAPQWSSPSKNYFVIDGYTLDASTFTAILRLMTDPKYGWQTNPYSNDTLGRPFWLIDWHDGKGYAWFPSSDGCYNRDDSTLAFILGVPCTPKLAHRDLDIPKQYPGNTPPPDDYRFNYVRTTQIRFHGNVEVREIINSTYNFEFMDAMNAQEAEVALAHATEDRCRRVQELAQKRQDEYRASLRTAMVSTATSGTTSTPDVPSLEAFISEAEKDIAPPIVEDLIRRTFAASMYTIADYMYYRRVISKVDMDTRADAHKLLIYVD